MKLLTLKDIIIKTGFKRSTIYKFMNTKGFPKPVKIGASSRWLESEVDEWIKKQMNKRVK